MSGIKRTDLLNFVAACEDLVSGNIGTVTEGDIQVVVAHEILANVISTTELKASEATAEGKFYQLPDITASAKDGTPCRLSKYNSTYAWAVELRNEDMAAHVAAHGPDSDVAIQWSWPSGMNKHLMAHPEEADAIAAAFNPVTHKPKEKVALSVGELQRFIGLLQAHGFATPTAKATEASSSGKAADSSDEAGASGNVVQDVSVDDSATVPSVMADINWVELENRMDLLCHQFFRMIQTPGGGFKSPLFTHVTPMWVGASGYNNFLYILHTIAFHIGFPQWMAAGGFQGAVVISPYGVDCSRSAVVQVVATLNTLTDSGWAEFQRYVKMGASAMEGLRNLAGGE